MAKLDKNIVLLEGLIGDDFKFGRTSDAKEMATFSLAINSYLKELADDTERTRAQTYVRIFVYDKKLLDYLRRIDVHRGMRASILGRLSSHKSEYKGIEYIQLTVIVRDIGIIQTKSFKKRTTKPNSTESNNEQKD